jgi:hypothetical protein
MKITKPSLTFTQEAVLKDYYSKYASFSIRKEILNKLEEMSEKIADEILEQYDTKTMLMERIDSIKDGDLTIVITLQPKENI